MKLHDSGLDVLGAAETPPSWKVALGASITAKLLALTYFLTRVLL